MTQYWLGLDCGGSWLKAGLYDREGREAGVQRLPLCALSPQPGWAERDMAELWQCCMAVIRELLTHPGDPRAKWRYRAACCFYPAKTSLFLVRRYRYRQFVPR